MQPTYPIIIFQEKLLSFHNTRLGPVTVTRQVRLPSPPKIEERVCRTFTSCFPSPSIPSIVAGPASLRLVIHLPSNPRTIHSQYQMSFHPKTPSHRGRPPTTSSTNLTDTNARNENANAVGPLTPTHNIRRNASPTKQQQPTRMLHRSSRSESVVAGPADTSNPFLVRTAPRATGFTKPGTSIGNVASSTSRTRRGTMDSDRPASPVKRSTSTGPLVNANLRRQASAGVIRKGGPESRMDVVSMDYVPLPSSASTSQLPDEKKTTNHTHTHKRTRSTPGHVRLFSPYFTSTQH